MNRFGMVVAGLQVLASVESCLHEDWRRALTYAGFAIGSAAIAWR